MLFYKHRRIFLWLKNQQSQGHQTREASASFFSFCASCHLDLTNSIATTQKCSCANSCSTLLALDLSGGSLTSFVFALAHTKSTHSNKKTRPRLFYLNKTTSKTNPESPNSQGSYFMRCGGDNWIRSRSKARLRRHAPQTGASDDSRSSVFDMVKSVQSTHSNPYCETKKRP